MLTRRLKIKECLLYRSSKDSSRSRTDIGDDHAFFFIQLHVERNKE